MSSEERLPDIPTIPERISFARRRAGYTQVRLAKELGIGERTLQSYESGETNIPAELVPKVERIADLPPGWVLYDGPAEEFYSRRRRLPPGTGLSLLLMVGALVFPAPGIAMSCHCAPLMPAREPRVSLAVVAARRTHPRERRRV